VSALLRATPVTVPAGVRPTTRKPHRNLARYLDQFLIGFPREDHLVRDPVQFVHRYDDPRDKEIVGFIASAFAYGNVRSVLASVERILGELGPSPSRFVRTFDPAGRPEQFAGFQHRWNNARDLRVLLWILGRLIDRFGSIESTLTDAEDSETVPMAVLLDRFASTALGMGHERWYADSDLKSRRGVRYFFPRASEGSACKRLNLYLRWMVRPADGIDCGLWTTIDTSRLIIPLDTHISRISRYIGLTELASPGWRMAEDVTRSLRRIEPRDPLRYDFALCHMGIAGDCPRKRAACPIQAICRL